MKKLEAKISHAYYFHKIRLAHATGSSSDHWQKMRLLWREVIRNKSFDKLPADIIAAEKILAGIMARG